MKIALKTIVVLFLLVSFLIPSTSVAVSATPYLEKKKFNYLFLGVDDTSGNTDSIILLSYDSGENSLNFLHIPRDTFCRANGKNTKINNVFKSVLNSAASKNQAMKSVSLFFEDALGVSLDGCSVVNTDLFRKFVDEIGGVYINLQEDFEYTGNDISVRLKKGENLLNGKTAEFFVRHRKSYKLGDLSRIDAQKIFISGLYDTLMHRVEYSTLVRAFSSVKDDLSSDFSPLDFILLLAKHGSKFRDAELNFATLPGAAVIYQNASYYVANKKASSELLKILFSDVKTEFDKNGHFTLKADEKIVQIYDSESIDYRITNSKEINKIKMR